MRVDAAAAAAAQEGLKSHDVSISSQCAAAIENLAIYHFTHAPDGERTEPGRMLNAHLAAEPGMFQGLLSTLLQIIVFEECANQWSLSRPLLPLILINESFFKQWQDQVCARAPARAAPHRPSAPCRRSALAHARALPRLESTRGAAVPRGRALCLAARAAAGLSPRHPPPAARRFCARAADLSAAGHTRAAGKGGKRVPKADGRRTVQPRVEKPR